MASYCGEWSAVAQDEEGRRIAVPIRCRSWSCRSCAPRNKKRLLRRLRGVDATRFLTLTCSKSRYASPDAAFEALSAAIPDLFKRIRRRFPVVRAEYFLVWETTKAGWPHAHLLLRGPFIPQRWLSRAWEELTGSPIVDIRRIASGPQAVAYVAKYLAKKPQVPPGYRRFRMSQAFLARVQRLPSTLTWSLARAPTSWLRLRWQADGYTVAGDPEWRLEATHGGLPPPYVNQRWFSEALASYSLS